MYNKQTYGMDETTYQRRQSVTLSFAEKLAALKAQHGAKNAQDYVDGVAALKNRLQEQES